MTGDFMESLTHVLKYLQFTYEKQRQHITISECDRLIMYGVSCSHTVVSWVAVCQPLIN